MASKPIVITILANARQAQRTIDKLQRNIKDLNKSIKGNKLGEFGRQAAIAASKMTLFAGAAAAAAPAMFQLAAALVPTVGALGVIPGLLASGASAMGAFKIATQGVSDAIGAGFAASLEGSLESTKKLQAELKALGPPPAAGKTKEAAAATAKYNKELARLNKGLAASKAASEAYAKALEKLPPGARQFAQSIVALAPAIRDLQASVAGSFFADLGAEVQALGKIYLPLLEKHLTNVAASLNKGAKGIAAFLRAPSTQDSIAAILKNVEIAIDKVAKAAPKILAGLLPLFRVSSKFLPQLADGFASAAESFLRFTNRIEQTGQLERWIAGGIKALKQLWTIARNVGAIFATIFGASGAAGNDLLGTIVKLTGTFKEWLRSAEGTSVLKEVFSTISGLISTIGSTGGAVFKNLADALVILAPALLAAAPALGGLITALAPILPQIASIAATLLTSLIPAMNALAGFLKDNEGAAKALAIGLTSIWAVVKLFTGVSAVLKGITAAMETWLAVSKLLNLSLIASKIEIGLNVAAMLAYKTASVAVSAATKTWTAIQWLFNAAMASNPIGLVVIAIAALVAGIIYAYNHSETFRKVVQAALKAVAGAFVWLWDKIKAFFGWLKDNWKLVLAFITGPLGLIILWISRNWDKIRTGIINVINGVISFLTFLPRKFIALGKNIIDGLIHGILNAVPGLRTVIDKVANFLPDRFARWLGIKSPSTVFKKLGEDTIDGFIQGFESTSGKQIVGQLAKDMKNTAVAVQGTVDLGAQGAGTVAGGANGGGDTLVINQYFQGLITDPARAGEEAISAIEAWQRYSGNVRLVPQT